jgi:Ca2+-binding EF-hand superfamily protein
MNLINKTEYLLNTFKLFDQDSSGKIDKSELKKILGQDPKF